MLRGALRIGRARPMLNGAHCVFGWLAAAGGGQPEPGYETGCGVGGVGAGKAIPAKASRDGAGRDRSGGCVRLPIYGLTSFARW